MMLSRLGPTSGHLSPPLPATRKGCFRPSEEAPTEPRKGLPSRLPEEGQARWPHIRGLTSLLVEPLFKETRGNMHWQ